MAGGKPSKKISKALLDFETALRINDRNKEAAALYDLIIMESVNRYACEIMLNLP